MEIGCGRLSRKTAAAMMPRFFVRPSQDPYERSSAVKKNRRAVAELVCQPSSVIDSYGPRTHLRASEAEVVRASMELRPSTEKAIAPRSMANARPEGQSAAARSKAGANVRVRRIPGLRVMIGCLHRGPISGLEG